MLIRHRDLRDDSRIGWPWFAAILTLTLAVERSQRFVEQALINIRSTRMWQIELAALKLADFVNPLAKRGPWVVRYAHAALFVAIVGLALLGWRSARPFTPGTIPLLWGLLAFHMLLAAIFIGGGKARLPIEPILLLLAGGGLLSLAPISRHKRYPS